MMAREHSQILRTIPFLIAVCFLGLPAYAKYSGGSGTAQDPYQIATAADLNAIGTEPDDWDKHFKLMADIDLRALGGTPFNVIGVHASYGRPFSGVFDGNGKTIASFTCNKSGATSLGLFAAVQGTDALITKLRLRGASVNAGTGGTVGALVGHLHSGRISRCHVDGGTVRANHVVGGLVGRCDGAIISSSSSANVSVVQKYAGGLAGSNGGRVVRCYTTGQVSGDYGAGLTGDNYGTVDGCFSTAQVSATTRGAAGLVALNGGTIQNSYATGKVAGPSPVGGLVGQGNGLVTSSFWDVQNSGQSLSAGGVGKTTVQMKQAATFAGWDFAGTWTIQEGVDYPRLQWETDPFPERVATTVEKVSGDNQSGWVGSKAASPLTVRVRDQDEEPMAGAPVEFTVIAGGGTVQPASAVTNAGGLASTELTLGATPGLNQVKAAIGSMSVDFGLEGRAMPMATTIEKVSGDNRWALAGSRLASPLTVRVKDQYGQVMAGVPVEFTVIAGGGTVEPASAVTNAGGLASTELTLGATPGLNQVKATVGSMSVDFGLEGRALPMATTIEKVSGDNRWALAGSRLASPLTVRVKDQYGQVMVSVQVEFTVTTGGGTVQPASAVTNASGLAATELTLGATPGLNQVKAVVGGLSASFNVVGFLQGYGGGSGTAQDPYRIATAADLIALGETPENYDKHFILTADIDLDPNLPGRKVFDRAVIAPDAEWDFEGTRFAGVFDGNGYTISHLTIKGARLLGLFGVLESGGVVRDLGVADVNITGSGDCIGGLVGLMVWESRVSRYYSTGTVTGDSSVGGLVGFNGFHSEIRVKEGGTISECYSIARTRGDRDVGGLAGLNNGGVTRCYSTGTVTGDSGVGGLVAYNRGTVINCYSTGAVSGTGEWIGGLVGLVGVGSGSATASFWDLETSGQTTSAGGTGKTTAEMQTGTTFLEAGWDFVGETANGTEDIWWILEGKGYPRLAWEFCVVSPDPPNGATDVVPPFPLSWLGARSTLAHDIYFGEDLDSVTDATPESAGVYCGRQPRGATTYDPRVLKFHRTYYWRIDEVNEGNPNSPWKGSVWSFTTADLVVVTVVDDFERYTDDEGSRIYQTWLDGYSYGDPNNPAGDPNHPPYYAGNGTGSCVGYLYAPFAEQKIVHGGRQSMPMDYNNVKKPWYSDAERTWQTPQDWAIEGADTLTLYFRGEADNGPDPLHVGIEDSSGRMAVTVHPDADAALATEWHKWHIALGEAQAAGVDVAAVKKMVIGVGDRQNPKPGGTGRIYIDDIRLTKRMP